MDEFLSLADKIWLGEVAINSNHPVTSGGGRLSEVADGLAYLASFSRVVAFKTGDGIVMVDTGHALAAQQIHDNIRAWAPAGASTRLNTAIFSHGHVDHVFGVGPFEDEARSNTWAEPIVIGHEAMPARFDRYIMTNGYNAIINQRQFKIPGLTWPTEYRYPDTTYRDHLDLEIGDLHLELHHARGETDDHTWTWAPKHKAICSGDLFIFASPNCGNPQKVQRYPGEWAAALREMLSLDAEMLLPGHGFPVIGAAKVRESLTTTAELLETIVSQVIDMMNSGDRLNDIIHNVEMPYHLLERPWLRPVYDDPEFIIHSIWRQYGGWYDGDPSSLKPAPASRLASELADLAGGANKLAARAEALLNDPTDTNLRLAGHLAELAALAAPGDGGVHRVRAAVFQTRHDAESSTMAKGIFGWAAHESGAKLDSGGHSH